MNPSVILPHNSVTIPNLVMIHKPWLKKMPAELVKLDQKEVFISEYFQADLPTSWRFIPKKPHYFGGLRFSSSFKVSN